MYKILLHLTSVSNEGHATETVQVLEFSSENAADTAAEALGRRYSYGYSASVGNTRTCGLAYITKLY